MFDSLEKMDRTLNIGHSPSFVFVHPIGQCTFGHHHNVGATHLAGKKKIDTTQTAPVSVPLLLHTQTYQNTQNTSTPKTPPPPSNTTTLAPTHGLHCAPPPHGPKWQSIATFCPAPFRPPKCHSFHCGTSPPSTATIQFGTDAFDQNKCCRVVG
jgi:hypothetical protein